MNPTTATRLLCLCSVLWSCGGEAHPEPLLPLPMVQLNERRWGDFAVNLEITAEIERSALRRPSMRELVDAQVEAMVAYARRHGRGEIEESALESPSPNLGSSVEDETWRLGRAAQSLFPYLPLDAGPRRLAEAALSAVRAKLGSDAVYGERPPEGSLATSELLPEVEDTIAILTLGRVDGAASDRILAVLNQWGSLEPKPRAVVLDLSHARFESMSAASLVLSAFTPGQPAFEVVSRNPESGEVERRAWRAEPGWGSSKFERTPLFVVTSAQTEIIAEAIAHALRQQRGAQVLGAATSGTGRWMSWYNLPWKAAFGFTVAEIIGADGEPLAGRPVIPDICSTDTGLVRLADRSPESYRVACGASDSELDKDAVLEYIRQTLAAETESEKGSLQPLQNGEEQG